MCTDTCVGAATQTAGGLQTADVFVSRASEEPEKLMKPRVTRWDPGDATAGLRQKYGAEAQAGGGGRVCVCVFTDGTRTAELHHQPGSEHTSRGTCSR